MGSGVKWTFKKIILTMHLNWLELAGIGYWELDVDNEELYWSPEVKKLHEVEQDYLPTFDKAIEFYPPGENREKIQKAVRDAIESGNSYDLELEIVTAKGNSKWVRTVGAIKRENGYSTKVYGSTQDITKQKSVELTLKETEKKYQNILEHSTILFYQHDVNNNLIYLSPQAQDFFGIDSKEAERVMWTDFITDHPHNKVAMKKTNAAFKTGKVQPSYNLQLQKKNGDRIWVEVNEAPVVEDGKTVSIVGSLTNITERLENEKELERLSRVARETQSMVIITDPEESITWVNKAFEKVSGYSFGEVKGKNPGKILQGPKTESKVVQDIAIQISREEPFSERILNYSKDGSEYWINMHVSPIKDEKGEVVEFFSIQDEITEEVHTLQKLKKQTYLLKEAQHVAQLGNWLYDINTEEIIWSDTLYDIFDRNIDKGPPSFSELIELYNVDGSSNLEKLIENALEAQEAYEDDFAIKTEKGTFKYVKTLGYPILNDEDEVIALRGFTQDITKRKTAELELKEKQKQFNSITNNLNGFILRYLYKPDGTHEVTYISEGVSKVYELSVQEAIDSPEKMWEQKISDDVDGFKKSIVKSAKELSYWNHTWRIITPSGKLKWLSGIGPPAKLSDGTTQWDILISDVTEQESIKREVLALYNVLQRSDSEVYIFSADTLKFEFVNESAIKNLGYSKEQVQELTPLDLKEEYTYDQFRELINPVISGSKKTLYLQTKHQRKDGSTYPVDIYLNKDTFKNQEVLVANVIDISEHVEIQDKNKILLQEIHHRVKNNLAIISGLLSLEMDEFDNKDAKLSFQSSINRIHSMAKVHELLYENEDFSAINIAQYVNELSSTIGITFDNSNKVEFDLDAEELNVNINVAIPLGMLLNELLTNSFKYAFNGQGGKIGLRIIEQNGFYKVTYRDNGKGMSEKPDLASTNTLGFKIIYILLNQIEADFNLDVHNKFELSFSFKAMDKGSHSSL